MASSPFHAYYKARCLSCYSQSNDRLLPVFASSNIEAYPFQIAAAMFALRSPYLKGAILCDEGSLGKTYEAMLVVAQMWHEGKQNILIVVPTPLFYQWKRTIVEKFTVPLFTVDNQTAFDEHATQNTNPFLQDGILLTTYDFAAEKADYIAQMKWDITVFEEAHHLRRIYTGENKGAMAIREATRNSYKLLLTATPMQNSILDLYGLINFIDERVFPDEEAFYSRYFRRPENYPELAGAVSKYCFRTTRAQVANYVKIPERIPITAEYTPTLDEQRLYELLDAYLQREEKASFPKMERYDLTLMLFRTLSSSSFALERTLRGVVGRLEALAVDKPSIKEELNEVRQMYICAASITENAKGKELLAALETSFAKLRELGGNRKALIFTENRTTQGYVADLLERNGYAGKLLTYSGDKTRDYTIMERFEKQAQILVTTDIAAEGFNLEFCNFIINYDLPYNTLTIEQRVGRCHRQGQQSDVMVLNFLNKNNFADVRMLELINKRILQFSGIFGMSDHVIGNFGVDLGKAFALARTKEEIELSYHKTLEEFEEENKQLVEQAKESLFTSFTKEVADRVQVTPQYIQQEANRINDDLWAVVSWFFEDYNQRHASDAFEIDKTTRTVMARDSDHLPQLFHYWTGSRNKPYRSLTGYGMAKNFRPHHGRITLSSVIGRGILYNLECADTGTVSVDAQIEPCKIGLYTVTVKSAAQHGSAKREYTVLAGKTASGTVLSDKQCQSILALPVVSYTESDHKSAHWLKSSAGGHGNRHELDGHIDTASFIRQYCDEMETAEKEEANRLRAGLSAQKAALGKALDGLRIQIASAEKATEDDLPRLERITAQKKLNALQKKLKQGEQNLFFDGLRLEQAVEHEIAALMDKAKYTADVNREFLIEVEGR